MKPLFLLDENVTEKIDSSDCISSERVVGFGTPDNIILERAIEQNLVIITQDIRFVLYVIKKGVNIV